MTTPNWNRARPLIRFAAICIACYASAIIDALPCLADDSPQHIDFTIDVARDARPISRFIYGVNRKLEGPYAHCGLARVGGNRWTAYNWTNNASNAGSDWQFQNDNLLGGGDAPGGAVAGSIENAIGNGAGIIVTIPIVGFVAADKNGGGDVRAEGPKYLEKRFRRSQPAKGPPLRLNPSPDSAVVFQDEFVNWLMQTYPAGFNITKTPIWFSLDNEPDLWSSTHKEIHPAAPTYAEVIEKDLAYARVIHTLADHSKVFGPVSYGWQGFMNLQNAKDANGREFLDAWLQGVSDAQRREGRRLIDALDVHWYPEARGGGVRITEQNSTPPVAEARMQAPRSLWDPTFTETSWITQSSTHGPIELIPRLQKKIEAADPIMRLAITEYNFGGGNDISGAIAQADVLGIFGREGLLAACEWPMAADESMIGAAFEMFVNFDGNGGSFGDTSVHVENSRIEDISLYAAKDTMRQGLLTVVAINKTDHPIAASIRIDRGAVYQKVRAFMLTAAKSQPQPAAGAEFSFRNRLLTYTMPGRSVSTLELSDKP